MSEATPQRTYAEIQAEIARLSLLADEMRAAEVRTVIATMIEQIKTYKITAADLGFSAQQSTSSPKKVKPTKTQKVYSDGKGNFWNGRGRYAKWLADIKDKNPKAFDLEAFRIN